MTIPPSLLSLQGRLIVSCQADPQDAFFGLMERFAQAAVAGGAAGIRANGPKDIQAIRNILDIPILGIQKSMQPDGKILITPSFDAARALVEAGATAVALDCTRRGQQLGALERLRRIKQELNVPVLADIATLEEACAAVEAGADAVLPTMRGYTDETAHIRGFEPRFLEQLTSAVSVPVIAEGRIDTPDLAAEAIRAGAFAVVVGTAITRPHSVARLFAIAVEKAVASGQTRQNTRHITSHSTQQWTLGIDLGGTNTKYGLVDTEGRLLWEETSPTPAASGRGGLLRHLKNTVQSGLTRARESGHPAGAIGIATAGWVDPGKGCVVYATENLPGWTGTQIAQELAAVSPLPILVENDANALAIGEKRFGAARNFQDFVCITLGTGVGGGCFIRGSLNRGAHFFANALGHICIEPGGRACSCGQSGCLEAYTNAAALLGYAHGDYSSTKLLIESANLGEARAVNAIGNFAERLACGCSLLVQLMDPEALILAGGLVQNNPLLLAALQSELALKVPVWKERNLKIMTSSLGYHAGVLGAAALANE